jgi:hypothetical protein
MADSGPPWEAAMDANYLIFMERRQAEGRHGP